MQEEEEDLSTVDVFSWLPTEVLLLLFSYLEPKELTLLSATCKALNTVGKAFQFRIAFPYALITTKRQYVELLAPVLQE